MVEWIDVFNTFIGGILPIIGSVIVAFLVIRSEKRKEEKKEFKLFLNKFYIENGILKVEEYISTYGTSAAFALLDIINYCKRVFLHNEPNQILQEGIDEINNREIITELWNRNYTKILDHSATMSRFGYIINKTIIKTIQLYSDLLRQTLNLTLLNLNFQIPHDVQDEIQQRQIPPAQKQELLHQANLIQVNRVINGMTLAVQVIDHMGSYLVRRMEFLKEYLLEKEISNYSVFIDAVSDEKLANFHTDMQTFHDHLVNYTASLRDTNIDQGAAAGTIINWVSENRAVNLFE